MAETGRVYYTTLAVSSVVCFMFHVPEVAVDGGMGGCTVQGTTVAWNQYHALGVDRVRMPRESGTSLVNNCRDAIPSFPRYVAS